MAGRWDTGRVVSSVMVREKTMCLYSCYTEAGGEEKFGFHSIHGRFENEEVDKPAEHWEHHCQFPLIAWLALSV
jgi:hypothetical protein